MPAAVLLNTVLANAHHGAALAVTAAVGVILVIIVHGVRRGF